MNERRLYHRHHWVSDTRVGTGWHLADNNKHPHPTEDDIEYQWRLSESEP